MSLPQFLRPKTALPDSSCEDIATFLSNQEGVFLDYEWAPCFDGFTLRIYSSDSKTSVIVHCVRSDLSLSKLVVRNSTRASCGLVLDKLESIARRHKLMRIIVHDLRDENLCASLRAYGYAPGLSGEDYRKLVT